MYVKPKYEQARTMRRKLTLPEFLLWERIRKHDRSGPVFRRQYAFGPYILDFYCIRAQLAVEADGQHHGLPENADRDNIRDAWLLSEGIEVYRLNAADILRDADEAADGVYQRALSRLNEGPLHPRD